MDDATDKLLDLSPFDLKHLLLLIFSSKEFTVDESKLSLSLSLSLSVMTCVTVHMTCSQVSRVTNH